MRHIPLRTLAVFLALLPALGWADNSDSFGTDSALAFGSSGLGQPAKLVAEPERSRHFAAVARHLELGGTLFGYVDIVGDVERIATMLRGVADSASAELPQAAAFQQDFVKIAADLGLSDVKAIGLSSVAESPTRFRNNFFLYTPGGRHGLLAGLGGPATTFRNLRLAPADTDVFCEQEIDLPSVYAALRGIVARVAGEAAVNIAEASLKGTQKEAGFSAYTLIQRWKGRMTCVIRFEPEGSIQIPAAQPFRIPAFSMLLRFDGIAPVLQSHLDTIEEFERSEVAGVSLYALKKKVPIGNWRPVIAIEGNTLYLATSRAFFGECRGSGQRLSADPTFGDLLTQLGGEGNGLTYVSPRCFTLLRQLPELNQEAAPSVVAALQGVVQNLPEHPRPLLSLRTNLPDGVLFRSVWHSSLKENLAAAALYNPVTIGALAAMAVPAFQKVRTTSQDKTIENNLRQLSSAAQQYYLENAATTATYDDLVGPDRYIRELKPVAGEDYRSIVFESGTPVRLTLPDGRVFQRDD